MGIQPDILLCRTENIIPEEQKSKIALFCNLKSEKVIEALDSSSIYDVPVAYHNQGLDYQVCKHFELDLLKKPDLSRWIKINKIQNSSEGNVNIGIVGKYTSMIDAYKSLIEAITHGGIANKTKINLIWIDAENIYNELDCFKDVHGIIVPVVLVKEDLVVKFWLLIMQD